MWRAKLGASLIPLCLGAGILGIPFHSGPFPFPTVREAPGRVPAPRIEMGRANVQQERLFSADDLMEFALEADWNRLEKDRTQESEERPGRILWKHPEAREIDIPCT